MASVTVSRKQSVKGARARPSKLSFLCRRSGELSCQCQTVLGNECEKVSRIYSDLTHGECKERGKRKHNYITRISLSLSVFFAYRWGRRPVRTHYWRSRVVVRRDSLLSPQTPLSTCYTNCPSAVGELSCHCQTVFGNECDKSVKNLSRLDSCKERGKIKHNNIIRLSPRTYRLFPLGILWFFTVKGEVWLNDPRVVVPGDSLRSQRFTRERVGSTSIMKPHALSYSLQPFKFAIISKMYIT